MNQPKGLVITMVGLGVLGVLFIGMLLFFRKVGHDHLYRPAPRKEGDPVLRIQFKDGWGRFYFPEIEKTFDLPGKPVKGVVADDNVAGRGIAEWFEYEINKPQYILTLSGYTLSYTLPNDFIKDSLERQVNQLKTSRGASRVVATDRTIDYGFGCQTISYWWKGRKQFRYIWLSKTSAHEYMSVEMDAFEGDATKNKAIWFRSSHAINDQFDWEDLIKHGLDGRLHQRYSFAHRLMSHQLA